MLSGVIKELEYLFFASAFPGPLTAPSGCFVLAFPGPLAAPSGCSVM